MTKDKYVLPGPDTLPADGMSRLGQLNRFLPFSRETFRKLPKDGKAPQPIRMGVRYTFYKNKEIHAFLAHALSYRAEQS